MSPRCTGRLVIVVCLIASEILTIKSNVNAFVIKQDPKKLAGVMAEIEDLNGGAGGFKNDNPNDNDKMKDMKHGGKTSSTAPIETTAKTEEIQKSIPKTTTTNKPITTSTSKPQTIVNNNTETKTRNISETKITSKPENTTTHKPQQVTISENSYIEGNLKFNTHDNAPTQTAVDFLLDNTETESTGSTIITNANIKETTEKNITTSYSIEAAENKAIGRSDASSTTEIDDDGFTLSTIILPTPKSQEKETTVRSIKSTIFSDVLTTDNKPLHWKKYKTIDRKRNNIDLINAETLPTTEKEYELATAETKHQNPKNNKDFVSTPEWYYENVKQEVPTSTETDSSAKTYNYDLTNSISQNQALPTTENIESLFSPGQQSPIYKVYFQETPPSTGPALLLVTLSNQYNSSSENIKISHSTSDSHATSTAVGQTNTPSITSTQFLSTTDIPKGVPLIETSKDLTKIDVTEDLSKNDVFKNPSTTESSTTEDKTEPLLSTSDVSSLRSPRAYNVTEAIKATESVKSTNEITSETMKGVLTSKRAGYLDMSSKPTSRTEITIADGKTITGRVEIGNAKKTTPMAELGFTTDRQVYYMQSQSQLSEDAINEELMKEEMMNDHIGYTQQNREQRKDKDPATEKAYKDHATDKVDKDLDTEKLPMTTDDILSVKPIGVDKQKTSGLYTVSPNYKPLKKIEVQPPKPFVRDPDDNSWRNESLSSLGIVFKANNSSKPLTQVLKNKTETELNSLLEKYGKSDEPELRERLEKIAEQRKTKKKVGGKSAETGDSDSYEVLNFFAESSSLSTPEVHTVEIVPSVSPIPKSSAAVSSSPTVETDNLVKFTVSMEERGDPKKIGFLTTTAPKNNNYRSFDGSDEEPDYSSLSNIDIKKTHVEKNEAARNTARTTQTPVSPERKATVQYFPPRATQTAKVNLNDYDYDFKRKVQGFEKDKLVSPLVYSSSPTPGPTKQESHSSQKQSIADFRLSGTDVPRQQLTNVFTQSPEIPQFEGQDGFNGASFVIKHLRDFVHLAARESEEDRVAYLTEPPRSPIHGANAHAGHLQDKVKLNDYEEYDTHFRKNVLDKFVENFNQNSERFKVDFPVLYNTSIIHNNFADEGKQASSSAFMKRLYGSPRVSRGPGAGAGEADCPRAVELAPEYELHYYVPEQEEREVAHSEQLLSPVRYRLRL